MLVHVHLVESVFFCLLMLVSFRGTHLELVSILYQVTDVHVAVLLCLGDLHGVIYKRALDDEQFRSEHVCIVWLICELNSCITRESNLWLLQAQLNWIEL